MAMHQAELESRLIQLEQERRKEISNRTDYGKDDNESDNDYEDANNQFER